MRALVPSLALLLPGHAMADGMPIDANGRFEGGLTVVLRLTASQKRSLAGQPTLTLTLEQRAAIIFVHGFSPGRLRIYDTRKGENDCTCHAFNRGLRYSESELEVPRVYLVTDQRAAELERELASS